VEEASTGEGLLPAVRQAIGEHHPAFGIGVADADANTGVRGDDLIGDIRVRTAAATVWMEKRISACIS
jgi:hypothetical protein